MTGQSSRCACASCIHVEVLCGRYIDCPLFRLLSCCSHSIRQHRMTLASDVGQFSITLWCTIT